jgi:hypothetical protein
MKKPKQEQQALVVFNPPTCYHLCFAYVNSLPCSFSHIESVGGVFLANCFFVNILVIKGLNLLIITSWYVIPSMHM